MIFLKVLGWIFVPYVMIFIQWKRLNVTWRVFGIIWAMLALSSFANATHKDNTAQKASAPAATVDSKNVLSPTVIKPVNPEPKAEAPKGDNQVKPEPKAANQTEGDSKQAIANQYKSSLLAQHPEISDFGVVGDLGVAVYDKVDSADFVGDQYLNQQAKGVYQFLRVDVMNYGKRPLTVDASMFRLVAPDGTIYEADPTAARYANVNEDFFLERINPGTEAHGYLVFDMPEEVKGTNLVLRVRQGFNHVDLNLVRK